MRPPAVRTRGWRVRRTCCWGRSFPQSSGDTRGPGNLKSILEANGFDHELHEQIRSDLRSGRIGLAQNRLPASTVIEDMACGDGVDAMSTDPDADQRAGEAALANGEVAALALAGGAGSRWTRGAGVVKALHPFCRCEGKYRNFIEIHLAKGRKTHLRFGTAACRSWYRRVTSRTSQSNAFFARHRVKLIPVCFWHRRAVRSACE